MRKIDILEHEFIGAEPDARELWIGCIEGPALPEASGRLVYRNAGNIVSATDLAVLAAIDLALREFRIRKLVICGHHGCRCASAEINGVAGQWLAPFRRVRAAYRNSLERLPDDHRGRRVCELNVMEQVLSAARTSAVTDIASNRDPVTIDGVVYDNKLDEFVTVCSVVCPIDPVDRPTLSELVTVDQDRTF